MDNLKDLYAATRAYELKNGLADTPRLSTSILKERIGNNENIAGKLQVWRGGEWCEALGYISKDELLRLAPEEWQVGDVLETTTEYGGWQGKARLVAINESSGLDVRILELTDNPNKATVIGELIRDCNPKAFRLHHPTPEDRAKFERLAANAKLKAEWEKEKFAVQFLRAWDKTWRDCVREPYWDSQLLRRKPDPVYVPWTLEDAKEFRGIWVRHKMVPDCAWQINGMSSKEVNMGGRGQETYEQLFKDYVKYDDGTPCGKVKEEGK